MEQRIPYQSQRQAPCLSFFHRDASVFIRGGSLATEYQTAHAYRLGAFQLVRKWFDAFHLQLHNHTNSDGCLCIGRFSVLPLLLRQFQEAPAPSKELLETLHKELARFNPEAPLTMLFDYVKIRFPTLDIQHIIKDILKLNINYMLHEDYGHYSYTEHYSLGDIFIYTSADEEKGVLLELKGRGCRQFESYLLAQQRSWYDFLMDALVDGGVMKRIDLAINDHTGILDIPELAEKCRKREYIGKSRSYKFYQSGELIKHREDDREYMGRTLYLGSLKSDVYFCIYEKDYEQYVKLGTPLEEADIINRFEIRLRNERAYYAVRDLLTYYDAEQTAFSIINQYVRFVDEEPDKRKNDWKLNDRWAWFIGDNRQSLKLTTKPEPYTLDRTLRWVQRQVAPTLKMLKKIDKGNGTDYMETIEQQAKLTEKHEMIIKQQTTPAKDLVES